MKKKKKLGITPLILGLVFWPGKLSVFFFLRLVSIGFSYVTVFFLYMNGIILLFAVYIIRCYLLVKRITDLLI